MYGYIRVMYQIKRAAGTFKVYPGGAAHDNSSIIRGACSVKSVINFKNPTNKCGGLSRD